MTVEELAEKGRNEYHRALNRDVEGSFDKLGEQMRSAWHAAAAVIKSAVEGPLLEEVERLKREACPHGACDNLKREIGGLRDRAEKAEADLKATQEDAFQIIDSQMQRAEAAESALLAAREEARAGERRGMVRAAVLIQSLAEVPSDTNDNEVDERNSARAAAIVAIRAEAAKLTPVDNSVKRWETPSGTSDGGEG